LKNAREKRKKNGMWLSKSARDLQILRFGSGTVGPTLWLVIMVLVDCSSIPATFHPKEPLPPTGVTHQLWRQVLENSVTNGLVNYPVIQNEERFGAYLRLLDRVDPSSLPGRDQQLAFWINAYNAFAVQNILEGDSPAPYIGWYYYFKVHRHAVGGETVNLYDLEHAILRAQFNEPRVHFAIVCASVSCPKLQPWAYEGRQLEEQLDQVAREFVNDLSRNRFDREQKVAHLSKIFDWFKDDFVANAGSVQKFVARYVLDTEVQRDLIADTYRIEYREYDWGLNGTPPRKVEHVRSS